MNVEAYHDETSPRREILPGGAVLLTRNIPGAHSVAFGCWLRVGSQDESLEQSGLSHFIEHIVFKGSRQHSAFEIASIMDGLGASLDAFTTKDQVAFTLQVLPEYFDSAASLMAEMLLHPALDPAMVALEQDVVCEEIQEAADTPEDCLHDAFAARLYGDHPRGRPILGTPESVRSFDPDFLRHQHARLFAGPNVVLSLAGNVSEAACDVVRRNFGFGEADPLRMDAAGNSMCDSLPGRLELEGVPKQAYFEIGNRAVSFYHADRIPMVVLANLLGGGMSSRIFQAVREREGLAYSIYTYCDMGRQVGLVSTAGSCSPTKIDRVEAIIRRECAELVAGGIAETELAGNRAQIKSQLVFSLEGIPQQMQRDARNELYFGRFVPVTELIDQIDSVRPDDIIRCAGEYYDPAGMTVATHGPAR